MYSLIKGYLSSENTEDRQEEVFSEEALQICQRRRREAARKVRSRSEGSAVNNSARYLSWQNVSYVGDEIRKTVSKGLQWIAFSSAGNEMASKTKRTPPNGTTEYLVDTSDTLAKIALRFDTTPSELTRINKLASRMLFPGQTLFVPQKNEAVKPSECETSLVQAIIKPPQPLANKESNDAPVRNHEAIKLTKGVTLDDEEEEVTENYLKIYAKYITDGQGIINGVLLVTPHSVMFNPNVSDPLVMERGRDTYCIATPMSAVTSAAMYKDIAAMAIHAPLKPGRFHLDAATAESLSRQNSVDADLTPPLTPKNEGKTCGHQLAEIREASPTDPHNKLGHVCPEEHPTNDNGTDRKSLDCACNNSQSNFTDIEDVTVIVQEVLDSIITEITETEDSQSSGRSLHCQKSTGTSSNLHNTFISRDLHSVSPVSEDSGIGCSLNHPYEGEVMDSSLSQTSVNGSSIETGRFYHNDKQAVAVEESSKNEEKSGDNSNLDTSLDRSQSSSLFSALSNEVKYWLGKGSYVRPERNTSESDEEVDIVPRPAAPSNHQPLYLCLRISKKHWCRHHSWVTMDFCALQGEELMDRDQRRREYWFAIPHSRTEQVYGFFQQWCPNIHNATDEESDDEPVPCTLNDMADEEGIEFVETFYSNSPSSFHPKVARTLSDSDVSDVKRGFRGLKGKPGKATQVITSPKPSPDFIDDAIPDMDTKSEILKDIHLRKLNAILPSRTVGHCWVLVYSTFQHGFSLKTLYRKMECYDTPVLVVVMDGSHHIFGALCSCPLRISEGFFGTGESFLYKFHQDKIKIFRWSGNNNFFMKGSKDSVAIGSGGGNFGLWLDEDLYHGSSHSCQTYDNEQLSSQEDFLCSGLEAWTFV